MLLVASDVDDVGSFPLPEFIFQKQLLLLYGTIPSMIGVAVERVVSFATTIKSSTVSFLTVLVSVEPSSMHNFHLSKSVLVKQPQQQQQQHSISILWLVLAVVAAVVVWFRSIIISTTHLVVSYPPGGHLQPLGLVAS